MGGNGSSSRKKSGGGGAVNPKNATMEQKLASAKGSQPQAIIAENRKEAFDLYNKANANKSGFGYKIVKKLGGSHVRISSTFENRTRGSHSKFNALFIDNGNGTYRVEQWD